MKNVFGVLCEKGKEERRYDGERFVVRKADSRLNDELESFLDEALDVEDEATLPCGLSILKWIAEFGTFLLVAVLIRNWGEVSFAQMFSNSPAIIIGGAVCALVWLSLFFYEKFRFKKADKSGAIEKINSKADKMVLQCEEELGIPHDAPGVDIFSFEYKEKNGKDKIKERFGGMYSNHEMRLFKEDDNLCLADFTDVYAFSLDGFKKLVHKKKRASFDDWNKEEEYNKGEYKQYKIRINDYGTYFCKYYALQYADVFGEYEIFFPEYELKHFEQILNLPIEEE